MVTMKDVAKAAGVSELRCPTPTADRVVCHKRSAKRSSRPPPGRVIPDRMSPEAACGPAGSAPSASWYLFRWPRLSKILSTALLLRGIVEVSELADVGLTLLPVSGRTSRSEPPCPIMPSALRGLVDGVVMHCLAEDHPVVEMILARRIPAVATDSRPTGSALRHNRSSGRRRRSNETCSESRASPHRRGVRPSRPAAWTRCAAVAVCRSSQ